MLLSRPQDRQSIFRKFAAAAKCVPHFDQTSKKRLILPNEPDFFGLRTRAKLLALARN